MKKRSALTRDLHTRKYRQRIVPNKKHQARRKACRGKVTSEVTS